MYLGIDLGTGSVKVLLLDRSGREITAGREYVVSAPERGRAESDPLKWLTALEQALSDVDRLARSAGGAIAFGLSGVRAVGFSGQMHGIVPVRKGADDSGAGPVALHPAILWADGRGAEVLPEYERLDPEVHRRLGNRPASGMAGTTLLWLFRHRPDIFNTTDAVLFPKDFVRAAFTGSFLTDYSDASGSLLYDFEHHCWYEDLISRLGLPRRQLPEIMHAVDAAGTVTSRAARRFGIPAGIPVAVGAGDTPAAMYGSGLTSTAAAQISVGTAAQVARPVDADELPGVSSINLFEGAEKGLRYQVAAMLNGGLALEWVRERLGFSWGELYKRLENRIGDDPGTLTFLPYLAGERTPYLDPDARGAWVGLSLHHGTDDLAMAALLGVACTVRIGLETIERERGRVDVIRLVGGSARFAPWRTLLATVLGRSMEYSPYSDGSARGAAYMAARLLGEPIPRGPVFSHQKGVNGLWVEDYYRRFLDLYQALRPFSR